MSSHPKIYDTFDVSKLSPKEKAMYDIVNTTHAQPRDPRFPSTNQAAHCFNRYNEWLVCLNTTKGDDDACNRMRQYALSMCPNTWTEKWDDEREEGTFPGIKKDY